MRYFSVQGVGEKIEGPLKILVVEDEAHIRRLVQVHLERDGYNVLVAQCALDALSLMAAENPQLLLIDYSLPDIMGMSSPDWCGNDPNGQ